MIRELPTSLAAAELKAQQAYAAELARQGHESASERAKEADNEKSKRFLDVLTLIVTAAVGATTVVILIVQSRAFWKQTEQLKRSVEEMRAATRVATSAAKSARRSAKAASLANEQSRIAFLGEQRPWVAITKDPVLHLKRGQGCWYFEFMLDVENVGKSPAQNVHASALVVQQRDSERIDVDAIHRDLASNMKAESADVIETAIFPGSVMQLSCAASLPDEWLHDRMLADGFFHYPVIVIGCVRYRFSQGASAHVTAFRYGINGSGSVLELPTNAEFFKPGELKAHKAVYRHNRGWFAD